MAKVKASGTAETVLVLSQTTGFSRFPVTGEDADDVRGVVHVKQAFAVNPADRPQVLAEALMVEPLRVPASMGVNTLLGLLRRGGYQIAVVSDEYGGTAGLVTLEDLVEELVGELRDEHDRTQIGVVRSGQCVTFDANLRPDELLERTGVKVPDDPDYETIAGFVTDVLDRIPVVGDEVRIDQGVLRVERVDGARIDRLRYSPTPATPGSGPERTHDEIVDDLREGDVS
jgi:CBS domain containing-hemolysin-like protein